MARRGCHDDFPDPCPLWRVRRPDAGDIARGEIAYDAIGGRSIKILGAGSAILFAALGGYITLVDSSWTVSQVKLTVDAGMLAIALASMAIRLPFTLQYAREMVDAETEKLPGFRRVSYVITWAWTLAFALMVMANILMIPPQLRALFHQMVFRTPADEVAGTCRADLTRISAPLRRGNTEGNAQR